MSEAATAEHGLIDALQTTPMIGTDGFVDWFCFPRFDSPNVFGALPDEKRGEHSAGDERADDGAAINSVIEQQGHDRPPHLLAGLLLMMHGRIEEAERELGKIEDAARKAGQDLTPLGDDKAISLIPEKRYGYLVVLRLVFREYPKRASLGASLMITQSFLYNAFFFTADC